MNKYVLYKKDNITFESEYGEITKYEYNEKKSKFISYVFNINSKDEAINYLDLIRKNHYSAKHIVYLYSVIENEKEILKFSDDGEPQGTGTKAIRDMLDMENITNVLIVIIRYFGGILLGSGPLARAYLNSFKGAFLDTYKKEMIKYKDLNICIDYDKYNLKINYINEMINNESIILTNKIFDDKVTLLLKINENYYDIIKEKLEE